MQLKRSYTRIRFSAETLEEAVKLLYATDGYQAGSVTRSVTRGTDQWTLDTDEEFFGEYRRRFDSSSLIIQALKTPGMFMFANPDSTNVTVSAKTRPEIERMIAVFDRKVEESRLPPPPSRPAPPPAPPVIFIGHGHSSAWRDLKDHLHEQHDYLVEAYETGARAGHTIRDVLDGMATRARFAILVMTGEDSAEAGSEGSDRELRARQNVVHEVGLFQGKLGWDRAIVAIEEGVLPFSNLQGVNQLRFKPDNIKEIYGDVLATLRREFPVS